MTELRARVRERLRQDMLRHGVSRAFEDPALFADVERVLRAGIDAGNAGALILPELLGDPETWRLDTALTYRSHRPALAARLVRLLKQRVLMPPFRWFFEYNRDNFERQRRVNEVLFAVVQELAIETARLRQELHRSDVSSSDRPLQ